MHSLIHHSLLTVTVLLTSVLSAGFAGAQTQEPLEGADSVLQEKADDLSSPSDQDLADIVPELTSPADVPDEDDLLVNADDLPPRPKKRQGEIDINSEEENAPEQEEDCSGAEELNHEISTLDPAINTAEPAPVCAHGFDQVPSDQGLPVEYFEPAYEQIYPDSTFLPSTGSSGGSGRVAGSSSVARRIFRLGAIGGVIAIATGDDDDVSPTTP